MCPNCHCVTPTWGYKKSNVTKKKVNTKLYVVFNEKKEELIHEKINCYNSLNDILSFLGIGKKAIYRKELYELLNQHLKNENVKDFFNRLKKVNKFPPVEEILKKLKESNFSKLSREIGCSDNGLRLYLIRNNIDLKMLKNK